MNNTENWVIIDSYSTQDAINDKILINISDIFPVYNIKLLGYVTTNLLIECGYIDKTRSDSNNDGIILPNAMDLIIQALEIIKEQCGFYSKKKTKFDTFYSGDIETPSGSTQQVFIVQNEENSYTIMLPEDY